MSKKWVYLFKEGNADMRNLLGGKGANLAEMTNLGMPIPQGFTVTTEACTDYYNSGKKITDEIQGQIFDALKWLEGEEQDFRRQQRSASGIGPFWRQSVYARYDGHHFESGTE